MQHVFARAKHVVESVEEYNKQEMYDGTHNVWVLKPVANCSGHGIRIYRQLEDIKRAIGTLKNLTCPRCVVQKYIEKPLLIHGVKFDLRVWYVLKPVANCSGHGIRIYRQLEDIKRAIGTLKNLTCPRCVVQKYIEKPLLIHGVKFDLRVWYVITNIDKFKIWVYHEGYVRFCSKPYSNILLDEARHLTNVRIQKQYRNVRDPPQLPAELMWDFKQLRDYFTKNMNLPRKWDMIMRAMEESIVTIMRCAQSINYIDLRKNSVPYSNILLDEARHLTNVRIQKQYRNVRDPPQLPADLGDKERLTQAMKTTQVDLLEWKKAVRVWKLHKTATHKSRKTI
ncbi:LOW QUALITY PROTEIN: tubulin monoglycylase TTLL3-like [Diaphorina citri]|uniref:LOW QUALITY PROTEIN: tubulin monoglycylase TTLL3-like n=1 Tax=Diaphorina citri TaxID=121845 RepID=A0A1S3DIF2_DIACI|nr:LOW QUALITY PROTEIN: tubulin monoglycylase TTLL3-like [Diaphorina citri]